MAKTADRYFAVDPWKIIEEGFDPAYSRVSESVFSLANETMGVRGCFDEGGSVDSLRGAYVNGIYDIEELRRSYRGIIDHTHFMIPAADWLMTDITVDGEKLNLGKVRFRPRFLPEAFFVSLVDHVKAQAAGYFGLPGEVQRLHGNPLVRPFPARHIRKAQE